MMAIPNTGRLVGQFYSKSCLMHTFFRPWVSRPVANPGQAKSKSNHVLKVFFSVPKRLFSSWSCNHELLRYVCWSTEIIYTLWRVPLCLNPDRKGKEGRMRGKKREKKISRRQKPQLFSMLPRPS
jgi:hypothetical protein